MITAVHAILYARDAEAARAFFRDTLGLTSVDAGEGWLIFALPPAELGIHPADQAENGRHQVYLMCEDIERTMSDLIAKGVRFTQPIQDHGWGLLTVMQIPGGGELGIYEPRHPLAAGMATATPSASRGAKPSRERQRAAAHGTATGKKKKASKKKKKVSAKRPGQKRRPRSGR